MLKSERGKSPDYEFCSCFTVHMLKMQLLKNGLDEEWFLPNRWLKSHVWVSSYLCKSMGDKGS